MTRSISWVQPRRGIRWLLERKLASVLGTMTHIQQMSMAGRLGRKKHLGVWGQASVNEGDERDGCVPC